MKWSPYLGAGVLVLALVQPAFAAEIRGGRLSLVEAGEVVGDDLIISGETVVIDGVVQGDVIATGREIEVNGTIEGDLMAAGQVVVLNGVVRDDVRIAGMVLHVAGEVGDDLLAAGMSLETGDGSRVGGGVTFVGMQVLVAGEVAESAVLSAQGVELRGRVGGDVEVEVGEAAEAPFLRFIPTPVPLPSVEGGLRLADSAIVGGALTYTAPQEASVASGTRIEGETEAKIRAPAGGAGSVTTPADVFWSRLRRFASLAVVGAIFLWALPGWTGRQVEELRTSPLACFLCGLLGLPVAAALFFVVVGLVILVAILFGLLGLGGLSGLIVVLGVAAEAVFFATLFVSALYLAQITVGIGAGASILGRLREGSAPFLALLTGVLLYTLLRAIPFVGGVVGLLVVLFGFGAIAQVGWKDWKQRRAARSGMPPVATVG